MDSIAPWVQLGFAVAVGWYLLTKQIPRMEERAERRDAANNQAHSEIARENRAAMSGLADRAERAAERFHERLDRMENGRDHDREQREQHTGKTDPGRVA